MAVHTVERIENLPERTSDANVVVVDVLTASTSIVALLDQGARYVRPFVDADAARAFGREHEDAVLVGEEQGAPLSGFDLVPLPARFRQADLNDRPVGIRTTNGTRAIDRASDAAGVFVGSTVNAGAVADTLAGRDSDSYLVAAGQRGTPSPEDTAGVNLVEAHYRNRLDGAERASIRRQIAESPVAVWLRELGLGGEVDAVLGFDSTRTVPRLRDGVFVPDESGSARSTH
ncbi:MAG: phosphosulfolactate phosphohydrolase related enzyme [halophilic archaeon J07HX64]|jgi:Phosphosulfolactate phosphohydrolase and related enzymes|nr:MAG: phosphosulfolactate phosphohydrolase related enzyme [halophilic archaeon J07HX64]